MQILPSVSSCLKSTKVGSGMISVFITNLGKYNEGKLIGEWLELPTTPEKVKQCFKQIGFDSINYKEFFLSGYKSSVYGITNYLSKHSNLDKLSHDEIKIYEAAIDIGININSIK
jgi:hypothetical protein